MSRNILGKGVPRLDAVEKATGTAQYTVDLKMPGLLYGMILRSPLPHAKIKSIDVSRAEGLRGVHAVITSKDVPLNKFSFFQWAADKTILAADKVRYIGDEVAAVAAVDKDTAAEAIDLIEVDYEPLPVVFDSEDAMKPDAPLLHDRESNVCFEVERVVGDLDKGFAECDYVCEGRYVTDKQCHCCLEVSNCIVRWDQSGRLTIWTNTQAPHTQRQEVARILGISMQSVRIISSHMGGGFGSKLVMDIKLPIAAILSKKTGRPVRIQNSRAEEFSTAKTRYGYTMYLKTGAKKDGRLWAREIRVIGDNGAYQDKGPATLNFSSMMFAAHYDIPNIRYDARLVYTNKQMGTAFRGFGNTQITFACEAQLDSLAEKMGMDPLELRLKNANQPGQITATGAEITSCGMTECMEAATRASGWSKKRNQNGLRGIGMANVIHTAQGGRYYAYAATDSFIKIADDGMVTLITPGAEMGQGIHTAMAQIVGEELGINPLEIRIIGNDTDLTPYDLGSWGSRGTFVCGNAALAAAREAKKELITIVSEMTEVKPEFIRLEDGKAIAEGPGFPKQSRTMGEIMDYTMNKRKAPISVRGQWADKMDPAWDVKEEWTKNVRSWAFGTQVVEVEIDEETGEVRILKVVSAHETGTTINQIMAEGQIEGPVVQGIGYALTEKQVLNEGKVVNDGFIDYKIMCTEDIPEIETILIETGDPRGPFGAKGIGESGLVPMAPAIANAIYNACGIWCYELPITREFILNALRQKKNKG
jgi:putative selenate reductase molybdopterin-binding subunit